MPHFPQPRAVDRDGATVLTFPYHLELIEAIKRDITAPARTYDPATKAWAVYDPYRQRAIALLLRYFPAADVPPARRFNAGPRHDAPPPRPAGGKAAHYAALCLTPDAPAKLVNGPYHILAKKYHPDLAPTAEQGRATGRMATLNAAIEALRAEGEA